MRPDRKQHFRDGRAPAYPTRAKFRARYARLSYRPCRGSTITGFWILVTRVERAPRSLLRRFRRGENLIAFGERDSIARFQSGLSPTARAANMMRGYNRRLIDEKKKRGKRIIKLRGRKSALKLGLQSRDISARNIMDPRIMIRPFWFVPKREADLTAVRCARVCARFNPGA